MKCFPFNFHQFWVKNNFSLKKNLIFWRLVISLIFWCMTCANKELRRMHHWKNSGKNATDAYSYMDVDVITPNFQESRKHQQSSHVLKTKLSNTLHIQLNQWKSWKTGVIEKIPQSEQAFLSICTFIIRNKLEFPLPFSILRNCDCFQEKKSSEAILQILLKIITKTGSKGKRRLFS